MAAVFSSRFVGYLYSVKAKKAFLSLFLCLLVSSVFTWVAQVQASCPELRLSVSERQKVLRQQYKYSESVAKRIAQDDALFARVVCGERSAEVRERPPLLSEGKSDQKQQEPEQKKRTRWPSYRSRLSREEIFRLKREAWEYRKWVESPLHFHSGRTRFVLQTVDPIPVLCAVGYDTVIVFPFEVSPQSLVVGNPQAFTVEVFGDRRAVRISPLKPFQATNLTVRSREVLGPEGLLTFFIREAYDEPSADYVVWVVSPKELDRPDEEKLLRFALTGDSGVFSELFQALAWPRCVELGSEGLIRKCIIEKPEFVRLYLFEGPAECVGGLCDFSATFERETVIGVKGHGKIQICYDSRCDFFD